LINMSLTEMQIMPARMKAIARVELPADASSSAVKSSPHRDCTGRKRWRHDRFDPV
jgi:hypothetical protein